MATALDPRELEREKFSRDGYKSQVKQFFRGIQENGLLITDPDGELKSRIHSAILSLPSSCQKEVETRWIEFLKNKKRRVVGCHPKAFPKGKRGDIALVLNRIDSCCYLDSIFSSDLAVHNHAELGAYEDSRFEARRRELFAGSPPLDTLQPEQADDLIVRSIRYSKWLRFYDKQLGRAESIRGFCIGIEYILSLWKEHGHFARDKGNTVTIVTVERQRLNDDDTDHVRKQKLAANKKAVEDLEQKLLGPLRKKFKWQIDLQVKRDADHISHSRHLEAQVAIIRFDLGFDLFDSDKKFKRNQLSVDNAFSEHLRQYRELPDAITT
jgi:hypothetical protein